MMAIDSTFAILVLGFLASSTAACTSFNKELPTAVLPPSQTALPPLKFLPFAGFTISSLLKLETPIQFRLAEVIDLAVYNAISGFNETSKDTFGRNVRYCTGDLTYATDEYVGITAVLAFVYASETVIKGYPISELKKTGFFGLGDLYNEVKASDFDPTVCSNIRGNVQNTGSPVSTSAFVRCAVDEMVWYFDTDGWNANGNLTSEYNRNPYEDFEFGEYKGYRPKSFRPNTWEPLLESDQLGFFFNQIHVTPYIGFTARSVLYKNDKRCEHYANNKAARPGYSYTYRSEMQRVFEQTRLTAESNATGDARLMAVELFDSKFLSILPAFINFAVANGFSNWEFWFKQTILTTALYDATLLVWREKVRYNMIRPTTVAKRFRVNTRVLTYAGPFGSVPGGPEVSGPALIKPNEWEPVIRTMPHAEYPSGSSCICRAFFDTVKALQGSDVISPPAKFETAQGGSKNSPGIRPQRPLTLEYSSWSEMDEVCGQSRLWGGMHFEAAVPGGNQLCRNLGATTVNRFQALATGVDEGLLDLEDPGITVCP